MLSRRRKAQLEQVLWNSCRVSEILTRFDSIRTLECWDYEGLSVARRDENYRLTTLAHQPRDLNVSAGEIEQNLAAWLSRTGRFARPEPTQHAGKLLGRLRMVLCDRPGMQLGMSLSRVAYESIEKAFDLHPSTLSAFSLLNGSSATFFSKDPRNNAITTIRIVVKAPQKTELTNCIISLTHSFDTGWTDVFVCGSGLTIPRQKHESVYGSQEGQFLAAILSEPRCWSNPLIVPASLLTLCTERIETRIGITDQIVVDLENNLGVTFAGGAGIPEKRDRWPEDIDVKSTIREVHSVLSQTIFLQSVCTWLYKYSTFLLELQTRMYDDPGIAPHKPFAGDIVDTFISLRSETENFLSGFSALRDRTTSQRDLLFSVISQQESLVSRRGNLLNIAIARSTKQDSISMSTFTFITAVFLPGTYIASLFSMSMFNWWASEGSSPNASVGYVSNKFWLYWAITLPLTMITLIGWYGWFAYANKKWQRTLGGMI